MPTLSNREHESFAQHVAGGLSLTEAAKLIAGRASGAANIGSRLAKNAAIRARIAELTADAVAAELPNAEAASPTEKVTVTKEWISNQLVEIAQIGMDSNTRDLPAATRALEALARLNGHMAPPKVPYKQPSSDLDSFLREQLRELPRSERDKLLENVREDDARELLQEIGDTVPGSEALR